MSGSEPRINRYISCPSAVGAEAGGQERQRTGPESVKRANGRKVRNVGNGKKPGKEETWSLLKSER